jgi:hypothetical protein
MSCQLALRGSLVGPIQVFLLLPLTFGHAEVGNAAAECEATEVGNDADFVVHMQSRVFLDLTNTEPQKTHGSIERKPSNLEQDQKQVAGDEKHIQESTLPKSDKNLMDKAEAQQATEAILREGLREAVEDLRGEWQQRLDELDSKEKADHATQPAHTLQSSPQQEGAPQMFEFRGMGGPPPSLLMATSKSKVLGKQTLQAWARDAQVMPTCVAGMVLGLIVLGLFVQKLVFDQALRTAKEQNTEVDAQMNSSAKLQHLLRALGFDPTCEVEEDGSPAEMQAIGPSSDTEEEPEEESALESVCQAILTRAKQRMTDAKEEVKEDNVAQEDAAHYADSQNATEPESA